MQFLHDLADEHLKTSGLDEAGARAVRQFVASVDASLRTNPIVMIDARGMTMVRRDGSTLPIPTANSADAAGDSVATSVHPHIVSSSDGYTQGFGTTTPGAF